MTEIRNESRKRRWLAPLALIAVALAAWGAVAVARYSSSNADNDQMPTFEVQRGPLTISVVQSGTIQALEQEILKSEVEGQTTIIYLIPEGTLVAEGELLVRLDASRLQDELVEQQIRVENAEASYVRARENVAVAKNQAQSDISKAELDYQFAREDVTQYVEGKHPQELREAESKITLAREELKRAAEKLEWSERLHKEKYISQTEMDADRLTFNRAKLDHELAVAALELLKEYTAKRQLAQIESNVDQAAMALERAKLKSGADIVQAEADLRAKEAERLQQQSKLKKIERQIKKTKIFAPRAGLVVYATSAQTSWWHGNTEPLDEGQQVRERQELIYLPTADAIKAEIQLHESNLDKVKIGLPATVTVDAIPGAAFSGRVAKIAPLPDAHRLFMNPDLKVYGTEIHIDGSYKELRTGMSCQAEIVIERFDDAAYVPVQAVVRIGDQPTVFLRDGDEFRRQSVEIGLDNNRMVRVVSGLKQGEEVLLTPPLDEGTSSHDAGRRGRGAARTAGTAQRSKHPGEGSDPASTADGKGGSSTRGDRPHAKRPPGRRRADQRGSGPTGGRGGRAHAPSRGTHAGRVNP